LVGPDPIAVIETPTNIHPCTNGIDFAPGTAVCTAPTAHRLHRVTFSVDFPNTRRQGTREGKIMTIQSILLPLFVEVVLTFVLLLWAGHLRVGAVRRGEVHSRDIALREQNWGPRETKVANAYQNQLEIPVLFYVLTILAIITRQADLIFVVLAWVFVVLRLLHATIHVTSNQVGRRFAAFAASVVVLAIMWAIFIVRILIS
jgi:hypothetical protein